jgi:hypothetical protein
MTAGRDPPGSATISLSAAVIGVHTGDEQALRGGIEHQVTMRMIVGRLQDVGCPRRRAFARASAGLRTRSSPGPFLLAFSSIII